MTNYDELINNYLDESDFEFNADMLYQQYKDKCIRDMDETGEISDGDFKELAERKACDDVIPILFDCAYNSVSDIQNEYTINEGD